MSKTKDVTQKTSTQEADTSRREALKKLGKYAYTAPVVLSLLKSNKALALSPDGPPNWLRG
jgi:hypothetical protein